MPLVLQLAGDPTVGEPWCDVSDLKCSGCDDVDLASVAAAASEILHILTARRYGTRRVLVRPTQVLDRCGCPDDIVRNYLMNTGPLPFFGFGLSGCGCGAAGGFILNGPVQAITAVTVDGVALGSAEYRLYDGRRLVRGLYLDDLPDWSVSTGYQVGRQVLYGGKGYIAIEPPGDVISPGHQPDTSPLYWRLLTNAGGWPCCQNLTVDASQPGTWSIDYTWGKPLPHGGKLAAITYTCHLAKQVAQGRKGVPDRATKVDRQGVSYTIDPSELIKAGRTGVPAVDVWLGAVNPSGARRRSRFVGPDTPTGARQA